MAASPASRALSQFLQSLILMRGPLSVADFMRHSLGHPQYGYYMRKHPVFGARGDFTTSPEISQMFGELLAVWGAHQLSSSTTPFRLVELGPGTGVLMRDIGRVVGQLPSIASRLKHVHLIETSRSLRSVQASTLRVRDMREVSASEEGLSTGDARAQGGAPASGVLPLRHGDVPITWNDRLADVPTDMPALIYVHELFDALPVHQCVRIDTPSGPAWRERLVDVSDASPSADPRLRLVLAHTHTPVSAAYDTWRARLVAQGLAAATPPPIGTVEEYSPAACQLAHELATRVRVCESVCLCIDYGYDRRTAALRASVRGIRNHEFVDMLDAPGDVDLSADVDFSSIAACALDANDDSTAPTPASTLLQQSQSPAAPRRPVRVHGPVAQGAWLLRLGLAQRTERLMAAANDEAVAERLMSEASRLVDPEQMGNVYKVLALTPGTDAAGFEA